MSLRWERLPLLGPLYKKNIYITRERKDYYSLQISSNRRVKWKIKTNFLIFIGEKKPNRLGGLMYRQTSLKHLQRSFNTHFITWATSPTPPVKCQESLSPYFFEGRQIFNPLFCFFYITFKTSARRQSTLILFFYSLNEIS